MRQVRTYRQANLAPEFLKRIVGRAHRAAKLTRDLVVALRRPTPRTQTAKIGLLCLVDLVQDLELILPLAISARAHGSFEVKIIATDWLDRVAPWVPAKITAAGFEAERPGRDAVLTGLAPSLEGWDALVTASDSTSASHRFAHALTQRAKAAGLATFTMQHGLENIGLTYRDDGDHDFASDWIFTWGDPGALPDWVSESVRARCIGAGRPASSATAAQSRPQIPLERSDHGRPIIAVFENLHWARYNEDYRRQFLNDLAAIAEQRKNLHFVLRPHPAGLFTGKAPPNIDLDNFTLADPRLPAWALTTAKDIIGRASAVITTPSTVALDAAIEGVSFAVARYGLNLEAYAPAPTLDNLEDWAAFLETALEKSTDQHLVSFRERHFIEGDACAAMLEAIAARVTRRLAPIPLRARAAAKLARAARALRLAPLLTPAGAAAPSNSEYARWFKTYEPSDADFETMRTAQADKPQELASILIDARAASPQELASTKRALEQQVLPCADIIVCDSTNNLNAALQASKERFVALIEAGDLLRPDALHVLLSTLGKAPSALLVYSDEDIIDHRGNRSAPHFKPKWSLEHFFGQDFACRLALFDAAAARAAGGFNDGPADVALYDLLLRLCSQNSGRPILHAPHVLYHRRQGRVPSDELMAQSAQHAAGQDVEIKCNESGLRRVRPVLPSPAPLVSLIVPTRDRHDLLRQCIEGLRAKTHYPSVEIIIIDNDSQEAATLDYFKEIIGDPRVQIIESKGPFNFSQLNNLGVRAAQGDIIGLINNDIAITDPDWLAEMAGFAARADVGAVGAMLLYPDGRIQHAGCTLGIGGVASHLYNGLPADIPGHGHRLRIVHEVSAVTAACLLTRRAAWEAVGGLDEEFPVAYNDIDYCMKVRRSGLRVLWTPFARLEHHESASRGRDELGARRARLDRDKARMRAKWGKHLHEDPFYSPNLSLAGTDGRLAYPPRRQGL